LYRTIAGRTGKDTQRVGEETFPRDETITAITVAAKVQARLWRKKDAKSFILQKDCKQKKFFADCPADRNAETVALRFEP
jgi:hypothetical protein